MTEEPSYMEHCLQILKIPSMVAPTPQAKYMTPENLKLLLSMPDVSTKKGRRHLVLLTVLYDTAARVSELVNIRLRDIRLDFPHSAADEANCWIVAGISPRKPY